MKRHILPGSREALESLRAARFDLYVSCRTMKALVRNAEHLVRQCERYGSTSNFARLMEDTSARLLMAAQDAVNTANSASGAVRRVIGRRSSRGS